MNNEIDTGADRTQHMSSESFGNHLISATPGGGGFGYPQDTFGHWVSNDPTNNGYNIYVADKIAGTGEGGNAWRIDAGYRTNADPNFPRPSWIQTGPD